MAPVDSSLDSGMLDPVSSVLATQGLEHMTGNIAASFTKLYRDNRNETFSGVAVVNASFVCQLAMADVTSCAQSSGNRT